MLFLFGAVLQKFSRKPTNVNRNAPRKVNAVIKLQTDETSHVSEGVKGGVSLLDSKSRNLLNSLSSLPLSKSSVLCQQLPPVIGEADEVQL